MNKENCALKLVDEIILEKNNFYQPHNNNIHQLHNTEGEVLQSFHTANDS